MSKLTKRVVDAAESRAKDYVIWDDETFRLLGDPTRLRILLFCLVTPRAVTEIAEGLDLSQTLVSHHLRLLRGARLVRGDRHSRQVFYQVDDEHVGHMLMDMANHVSEDVPPS